jgi:hypothetical protein
MHVIASDSFHSIHRWWTDAWKDWPRILKRWYWWTWIFVQYSTWGSYSDTQILVLPKLFLHCQSTQHLHTRYCGSMSISGKINFFWQEQFIKFQKVAMEFCWCQKQADFVYLKRDLIPFIGQFVRTLTIQIGSIWSQTDTCTLHSKIGDHLS